MAVSDVLSQELGKLVPASVLKDISCFVLYDHHPRDIENNIEITICTFDGEIKEYYKHKLVSSLYLGSVSPTKISILRNTKCKLYYIVKAESNLYIILKANQVLRLHNIKINVSRYVINDCDSTGHVSLKVFIRDDALPIIFDDNLEKKSDEDTKLHSSNSDLLPALNHLQRKLTEIKYNIKNNENHLKAILELHQKAAFEVHRTMYSDFTGALFKENFEERACALMIKSKKPMVKVCNQKLAILLNIVNDNEETLEDVHMKLHGTTKIIVYTSKLFQRITTSPFWKEPNNRHIPSKQEYAVAVVIELTDLDFTSSNIEFTGILCYTFNDKRFILATDRISLLPEDLIGDGFDVCSNIKTENSNSFLAVIATTESTDLLIRHIKREGEPDLVLSDIFQAYLEMTKISQNTIIHQKSPYHILNGILIICKGEKLNHSEIVSVFSRSRSQLLAFIHFIYNTIPYRLVITPDTLRITAQRPELEMYNEKAIEANGGDNYELHANSLLKQTSNILDYLDSCMVKMNHSKDPSLQSKIGLEIDILAEGVSSFINLKNSLFHEASKLTD